MRDTSLSRARLAALAGSALSLLGCGEPPGSPTEVTQQPGFGVFYDVVVVGAGTGGTAAAIQAARLGARVALVEETDCVGGQMNCAGVTSMDEGESPERANLHLPSAERDDGIYKEFVDRVRAAYGTRPIGTCYWSAGTVCFEPNVGQAILRDMLRQAGVALYTREQVNGFSSNGGFYPYVTTVQGDWFQGRVIIDATEYGDLLPLAGVDYRLGNSRAAFGINSGACVQDITYTAVIKKYPNGVPANLRITHPPEPADGNPADAYAIAAAKFRQYIAVGGTNQIVFGGTPGSPPYPFSWGVHSAYRGMPDPSNPSFYTALQQDSITKTGVNWANDFAYTAGSFDRANRFLQNCRAKLQTLQFLYYAQTELQQPLWSVADDTGYDSPWNIEQNSCPNISADLKELEKRMPPIPYVRESRRLVGVNTVVGRDILRVSTPSGTMSNRSWHDAIAIGEYSNDLHHCNGPGTLEADLESSSDQSGATGPFQIPLSALIPQWVDGLIAAEKNFSQSRLVSAASRLQPSTMLIGQGAGALAAFAVRDGVTPRNVPVGQVQSALYDASHRTSRFEYSDVPPGSASWKGIQATSTYDVMAGYGGAPPVFGPSNLMVRREAATALTRLAGYDTTAPATATFGDVPTSDPQFGAIEAMWREGLTSGCSIVNGVRNYCPNDPVARGQIAVFLSRAFGLTQTGGGQSFADVPPSHPFYAFIQALAFAGLAEPCPGQPGNFCPDAAAARGDVAAMISRFLLAGLRPPQGASITVTAGTYGGNVGAPAGNVTGQLAASCNGLASCNYPVMYWVIGDPVPGFAKDYLAEWTCTPGGTVHRAWAAAEAGFGSVVHLVCP